MKSQLIMVGLLTMAAGPLAAETLLERGAYLRSLKPLPSPR